MARRVMAALGAVVFGAGALVCAEPMAAVAEPEVGVPGVARAAAIRRRPTNR